MTPSLNAPVAIRGTDEDYGGYFTDPVRKGGKRRSSSEEMKKGKRSLSPALVTPKVGGRHKHAGVDNARQSSSNNSSVISELSDGAIFMAVENND